MSQGVDAAPGGGRRSTAWNAEPPPICYADGMEADRGEAVAYRPKRREAGGAQPPVFHFRLLLRSADRQNDAHGAGAAPTEARQRGA